MSERHVACLVGRGRQLVCLSPSRGDLPGGASREPVRPYGDDPLMLAMCHHLVQHGLADEVFLEKYCHEIEEFADYVLGRGPDRAAKTPECTTS